MPIARSALPAPRPATAPRPPRAGRPGDAHSLVLVGIDRRPADAPSALRALEAVADRFHARGDARAVFPDVYAVVTRNITAAVADGRTFLEPAWLTRVAGDFASRYFDALVPALVGQAPTSRAWHIAFARARTGPPLPVRDAILGINAHINYDLPRGLAASIRARGHAHNAAMLARYAHDHAAINGVLRASVPEVVRVLVARHRCRVTRAITSSRAGREVAVEGFVRLVEAWRARVWADTLALLDASDPVVLERTLRAVDRRARRIAEVFAGWRGPNSPDVSAMYQEPTHGDVSTVYQRPAITRGGVAGGLPPAP